MNDQPWKDSKTVQFAVGATLIIVFAWWMFTGDIPFLSKVAFSQPPADSEGNVQAVEWMPIVWGMLFQACVIVGMSVIGLFTNVWSTIVNAFAGGSASLRATGQTGQPAGPVNESPDGLKNGLTRAVAVKDAVSKAKYEVLIRKPYAMNELVAALEDGNFDAADELFRELKDLAGVPLKPQAKGGAK